MSRIRGIATLVVVAIGAFYVGGLLEFQYGGFAPDWVKSLLLYRPPAHGIDYHGLEEVFATINQRYVRPNPDGQKLTEGAAAGMVTALGDTYSRFLTNAEFQANNDFLQGRFAGVGASLVVKGDKLEIASILPNTPALRAGVKVGDVIIDVDGTSTKGWTADQAVTAIRGKAGTVVKLGVDRSGQHLTFNLKRETIQVPSVATHIFDHRVLYVRIFEFGERTSSEFDDALRNNLTGSVNLVVLDLRDNPGGFVDAADDVISEFVSSGTAAILVGRNGHEEVKTVTGSGRALTNKLVVLVNENSASAAEITAGALKDYARGPLVGVKTFGKGSVQQDFQVREGDLHLTIAHWLTPKRHSIDKTGIVPDDTVTLGQPQDEYSVDVSPNDFSRDTQLQAALGLLEA